MWSPNPLQLSQRDAGEVKSSVSASLPPQTSSVLSIQGGYLHILRNYGTYCVNIKLLLTYCIENNLSVEPIFEKSCYRIKEEWQMYDQMKEVNVCFVFLHYSAEVW